MQILCFSDSHGSLEEIGMMLKKHPRAELVLFLGDGLTDAEYYASGDTERAWVAVRGNCDFRTTFLGASAHKIESLTLCGKKIVMTHGDMHSAKSSIYGLMELAEDTGADAVLFGHTHTAALEYRTVGNRAVYFFNPGSLKDGYFQRSSYGIIELDDDKIKFSHEKL